MTAFKLIGRPPWGTGSLRSAISATALLAGVASLSGSTNLTTFTVLYTPYMYYMGGQSEAYGTSSSQQVGYTTSYAPTNYYGPPHAALWFGVTSPSFVDLNPAGALGSWAYGTSGQQQVGYATVSVGTNYATTSHAALWSGTAASFVDLHPAGATESFAYGINGSQQVGYATFLLGTNYDSRDHAALWSGAAASFVDLHPAGANWSKAIGISGSQQVGIVSSGTNANEHAVLWSSTAASLVDLHPAGANWSVATGTSGSQQVGSVSVGTNYIRHAVLWSGTAASFVDLHPAGANWSEAIGISGSQQVGTVGVGTNYYDTTHAALWSGTAASFLDLHPALGPGYLESRAYGVWSSGYTTYVAGYADFWTNGVERAILWKVTTPNTSLGQALDASGLDWYCSGDAEWFSETNVNHSGGSAAQSGPIGHDQYSTLQTEVVGPGTLTFWWKVSSESGYDSLYFEGSGHYARISGEVDWQPVSLKISAGPQTLEWGYSKDPDVSAGADAGWVDQVSFEPFHMAAPTWDVSRGFQFGLAGTPVGNYIIHASTNLRDWVAISTNAVPFGGVTNLSDTASMGLPMRFYRAQQR